MIVISTSGACLDAFFHYDDFWVLRAADAIRVRHLADLLLFFQPVNGFLLYRPLSTVAYFYGLRLAFGHDPVGYHATQMGFQVVNALLVYGLADRLFYGARTSAIAAAVVYVTAPGHAIAACWNALFTMTGAALFYFVGLWVWVGVDGRLRGPLALLCFGATLLSSEHGISFPLAVTAATVLVYPRSAWRHAWWAQGLMYVVAAAYVAAKLYYVRVTVPGSIADPQVVALIQHGYAPQFDLLVALRNLGSYVSFAVAPLYRLSLSGDSIRMLLGVLAWLLPWAAVMLGVLSGRLEGRAWRVTAFGLSLFGIALGPVLFLPTHVFSYYVGIAGAGLALAVVGGLTALTRGAAATPWAIMVVAVVAQRLVAGQVLDSDEFRFFRSFTQASAAWLYTVDSATSMGNVDEVVMPIDGVTDMVFREGQAEKVLLCGRYTVRLVPDIGAIASQPRRLVVLRPLPLTRGAQRPWDWLRRACPE